MRWHNQRCELATNQLVNFGLYSFVWNSALQLINFAKQVHGMALIHGSYLMDERQIKSNWPSVLQAQKIALGRMSELITIAPDNVVFENGMSPVMSYGDPEFEEQLLALQLPLAYDISHAFISLHGDNDRLIDSLQRLQPLVKHYHLVDSMGRHHDSLPLGQGKIDWQRVLRKINPQATWIYEIGLNDQADCREMMASHQYLEQLALR